MDVTSSPSAADFLALLRRLRGRGGYSEDPASITDLELQAWAETLADVNADAVSAAMGMFPGATELYVEDWERILRLINDVARSTEERQARVEAAAGALAGATESRVTDTLERFGSSGDPIYLTSTASSIASEGSEAAGVFQSVVAVPEDDYNDNATRLAMTEALRRRLPARAIGNLDLPDAAMNIAPAVFQVSAILGEPLCVMDTAAAFAAYPFTPAVPQSRVRSYASGSRVRAADWNAIQDAILWSPLTSGVSDVHAAAELGAVWARYRAVGGFGALVAFDTVTIDATYDWRQRIIEIAVTGPTTVASGTHLIMWGSGGDLSIPGFGTNIKFRVDAGTGALMLYNASASPYASDSFDWDITAIGMGALTGGNVFGETRRRLVDAKRGSPFSATLSYALLNQLRDRGGLPAVHRLAYIANTQKPSSGANTYVVDNTIDWRDRSISLRWSFTYGTATQVAIYPGASGDISLSSGGNAGHLHSGSGVARGSGGQWFPSTGLSFYVDTDGAFCCDRDSSDVSVYSASLTLFIHATEASCPDALLAAADGDPITAPDLNSTQDAYVLTQCARGYGITDDECRSFPFGDIVYGDSPYPVVFDVMDDARQTRIERRQRKSGSIRRWVTFSIAAGDTQTIDTENDWRDRIVWAIGRSSSTDIRPGQAGATAFNTTGSSGSGTPGYLGAGLSVAPTTTAGAIALAPGAAFGYADATTGALKVHNTAATTLYVTTMLEGSFQLGPRSVPAAQEDPGELAFPANDTDVVCWLDARSCDVSTGLLVDRMRDRSLSGNHAEPGAAPAFSIAGFGSEAGVVTTGAKYLSVSGLGDALASSDGVTVIMCLKDVEPNAFNVILELGDASIGATPYVRFNTSASGAVEVLSYGGSGSVAFAGASTAHNLASEGIFSFAIDSAASPSVLGIRKNGAPISTSRSFALTGAAWGAGQALTVGAAATAAFDWDGTIGQVMVIKRALSGDEIVEYENAMIDGRYGGAIVLAGTPGWT